MSGQQAPRPSNRHGLSQDIPDPLKRALRQACGYGCVICGCAIYQYEHIGPTFTEAREHDPERMALLCGSCHDKKTRGLLSKETAMLARNSPFAKREGFSRVSLDVAPDTMVAAKIGHTEFALTARGWRGPPPPTSTRAHSID